MLQELIHKLRQQAGAKLNPGVSMAGLDLIESEAKLRLPEELRTFYLACNGCQFEGHRFELLSLQEANLMRRALEQGGWQRPWQYWPLTENNDSNPFCICCEGPLRGYVVHVFHDDESRLKWRSFQSFLNGVLESIADDEWVLEFTQHGFTNEERTASDIEAGRSLLRLAKDRAVDDLERGDICRFASWLLSSEQWADVAGLLETEDEYVRREVCDRLKTMRGAEARRALQDYGEKYRRFVLRCAEELSRAGLRTNVDEHTQLHVLDGPIGLNMPMLYTDRDRPDFDQFIVQRTRELIALKQARSPNR